jgi:hypothetical protein
MHIKVDEEEVLEEGLKRVGGRVGDGWRKK